MTRILSTEDGLDKTEAYDLSTTAQIEQEPSILRDPIAAANEDPDDDVVLGSYADVELASRRLSTVGTLTHSTQDRRVGLVSEEICEQIAVERSEVAFQEFYEIVAPKMYALLRRMLRTEDDALDVMQETFIRLWNKAPVLYKIHTNLGAWSHHLARNIALDEIKSKHYKYMKTSQSFEPELFEDFFLDDRTPESPLAETESKQELKRALARLRAEERQSIELVFFAGHTQKQASESMGLTASKFSTIFQNALAELEYQLVPTIGVREAPHRPVPASKIQREKKKEARDYGRMLEEAMQATSHIVIKKPPSSGEDRASAIERFTNS